MEKIEILISSPFDREKLVAEIWYEDCLIAEINQEHEELEIELYPISTGKKLPLNEFCATVETAKKKLLNCQ